MSTADMTFGLVSESKKKAKPARKPAGGITLAGDFGLYVYDIEYGIDDVVVWGWSNDPRVHRSKVRTDRDGRSYFMAGKMKMYFDEIMRY